MVEPPVVTNRFVLVNGLVQGVGFRPFVYRLATELGLFGHVRNTEKGVEIFLQGTNTKIESFLSRLVSEKPLRAKIDSIQEQKYTGTLDVLKTESFRILESSVGIPDLVVPPDASICDGCKNEILDSNHRRFEHGFTHCLDCGPRFSIIDDLPYDRSRTTMRAFEMCAQCESEYLDPDSRRFHAQTNCCLECGPKVFLLDSSAKNIASGTDVYRKTAEFLNDGKIVGVKGVGGFQIWVDAQNDFALKTLRERKRRLTKPFAVMFPSLESVHEYCEVDEYEERELTSVATPIVLLTRKNELGFQVSLENPYIGAMLPASPIQVLVLKYFKRPVIATSANLSGEPICIENEEACERLSRIVDYFIVHDRKIVRPLDDSIVQVVNGASQTLRVGRGLAPLEVSKGELPKGKPMIAFGSDLKSALAFYTGKKIFLGPHLGDLEDPISFKHFENGLADQTRLLGMDMSSAGLICDKHPEYFSSKAARLIGHPFEVQHHRSHAWAVWLEAGQPQESLIFSWDGTGFGEDGKLWGSEVLQIKNKKCERVGSWATFPLPGGEAAIREPRRSLLGLVTWFGLRDRVESRLGFSKEALRILDIAMERKINTPMTSSMGRIFDAVSFLLGIGRNNSFEGEAAMALEFAAKKASISNRSAYEIDITDLPSEISPRGLVLQILNDLDHKIDAREVALKFHIALSEFVLLMAQARKAETVLLTGGVFQNRLLTKLISDRLKQANILVKIHRQIPPNDGGVAVGQLVEKLLTF